MQLAKMPVRKSQHLPELLNNNFQSNLFFLKDEHWRMPFTGIFGLMQIPDASDTAEHLLFQMMVSKYLSRFSLHISSPYFLYINKSHILTFKWTKNSFFHPTKVFSSLICLKLSGIFFGLIFLSDFVGLQFESIAKQIAKTEILDIEEYSYILECIKNRKCTSKEKATASDKQ